jgi:hypothetical protein
MPQVKTTVDVGERLRLFALERYPFACDAVMEAFAGGRDRFAATLRARLGQRREAGETTPGVPAARRWEQWAISSMHAKACCAARRSKRR